MATSTSAVRKVSGNYCAVVKCYRNEGRDGPEGIKFFRFPKNRNVEQHELWVKAVSRLNPDGKPWVPGAKSLICSDHFVRGKPSPTRLDPDYVPSIFSTGHKKAKTEKDTARFQRLMKRRATTASAAKSASASASPSEAPSVIQVRFLTINGEGSGAGNGTAGAGGDDAAEEQEQRPFQEVDDEEDVLDLHICGRCREQFTELELFLTHKDKCRVRRSKRATVGTQTESVLVQDAQVGTSHHGLPRSKGCQTFEVRLKGRPLGIEYFPEHLFKSFTGVSREIFGLLKLLLDEKIKMKSPNLDTESMLQLFLVKCKLCLTYRVMGGMFSITEQTASKWFKRVMHELYDSVKGHIVWFDRARIRARMPAEFSALYPRTRMVIDCTEVHIQRPSKQNLRVHTYSNYKSDHTIKILVGIAPSGEFTFVSKAFGGRATDCEITVRSGLLDLLERGDEVMADKGFPSIEQDVFESGAILVMPPFSVKSRPQFTHAENKSGYEIAKVRIHVERAIERIKRFDILHRPLQSDLVPQIDKIVTILCFIANLLEDLIKPDD